MTTLLLFALAAAAPIGPAPAPAPLYGFWGLDGFWNVRDLTSLRTRIRMGLVQMATTDPRSALLDIFPAMKAAGVKVSLRLTGGPKNYTLPNGDFSLPAWKFHLEKWHNTGIEAYISDGTVVGHMLLDDIKNYTGRDPTAAELDEMARYSHELFPEVMAFVRERATAMPVPDSGKYEHVDAIVNQYKALDGDVATFAMVEANAAARLDLGVINGLNIANGGDGSSRQPGWAKGRWAMSAEEIRTYGKVMAGVPTCGMFLNWEYDGTERWVDGSVGSTWFDRPDVEAALAEVGDVVSRHPYVKLTRR